MEHEDPPTIVSDAASLRVSQVLSGLVLALGFCSCFCFWFARAFVVVVVWSCFLSLEEAVARFIFTQTDADRYTDFSLTQSLFHTHTITHSHIHTFTQFTHSHNHSFTHTHSHIHTFTHSHIHTITHSHTHTLSLTHSYTLTHTLIHTLTDFVDPCTWPLGLTKDCLGKAHEGTQGWRKGAA